MRPVARRHEQWPIALHRTAEERRLLAQIRGPPRTILRGLPSPEEEEQVRGATSSIGGDRQPGGSISGHRTLSENHGEMSLFPPPLAMLSADKILGIVELVDIKVSCFWGGGGHDVRERGEVCIARRHDFPKGSDDLGEACWSWRRVLVLYNKKSLGSVVEEPDNDKCHCPETLKKF